MKESPILFNTEMVQALDAGRKSMTRRTRGLDTINENPDSYVLDYLGLDSKGNQVVRMGKIGTNIIPKFIKCPYGNIGDLLWVQEIVIEQSKGQVDADKMLYPNNQRRKTRFLSRTRLKITDIRIERIQDISASDAIAEGIEVMAPWPEAPDKKSYKMYLPYPELNATNDPVNSFFSLFISINGDDAVIKNPWVWVIVFEKHTKQGLL